LDKNVIEPLCFYQSNEISKNTFCKGKSALKHYLHNYILASHLADTLTQSDLQEKLVLSALLKGTSTYFHLFGSGFEPANFQLLAEHSS
jgi:hypothetical protein